MDLEHSKGMLVYSIAIRLTALKGEKVMETHLLFFMRLGFSTETLAKVVGGSRGGLQLT